MKDKVAHVRAAKQTRGHGCHWPGCDKQVPPAMWGCPAHWFKVPLTLRRRLWAAYLVKQEDTLTPSEGYLRVAQEIQAWIVGYLKEKAT